MAFESFSAFLHMGGYALYVWLSYGFTAIVLTLLIVFTVRKTRQIHQEVRLSQTREKRMTQAKEADLL